MSQAPNVRVPDWHHKSLGPFFVAGYQMDGDRLCGITEKLDPAIRLAVSYFNGGLKWVVILDSLGEFVFSTANGSRHPSVGLAATLEVYDAWMAIAASEAGEAEQVMSMQMFDAIREWMEHHG